MTIPRPTAMYDTECYPNFWLLKLKPRGCPTHSYRLKAGECFSVTRIAEITALFRRYTVVSFNGLGYDVPMITGALSGFTPEQLKVLNEQIQVAGGPFELQTQASVVGGTGSGLGVGGAWNA